MERTERLSISVKLDRAGDAFSCVFEIIREIIFEIGGLISHGLGFGA